MTQTISDWILWMEKVGLSEDANELHSDKLEDAARLRQSGLPIFEDLVVPFEQFHQRNRQLEGFLSRYKGFVVRAIPSTRELPRRYKIGVRNFEDCQEFLAQHVQRGDEQKYSVFLTEYEPSDWGGIIISPQDDVLIEVAPYGVDELSHGRGIPEGGQFAHHDFNHFRSMRYNTKNEMARALMWRALQYLRRDLPSDSDIAPNLVFMKGYFEFVRTKETDRIKFIDFKVNERYLK